MVFKNGSHQEEEEIIVFGSQTISLTVRDLRIEWSLKDWSDFLNGKKKWIIELFRKNSQITTVDNTPCDLAKIRSTTVTTK